MLQRYAPTMPRKSPDTPGGRAGQFTDARKQAANRLALLSRGPEKKKSISKRSLAKLNTEVKISEGEAPKKKKAKPSVPEDSNGHTVDAAASSGDAPAAAARVSSSAAVRPVQTSGDAPAAVNPKP